MANKIVVLILILIGNINNVSSQTEEANYVHKGLVRTTLTFATGFMPKQKINNLYLTGNIPLGFFGIHILSSL